MRDGVRYLLLAFGLVAIVLAGVPRAPTAGDIGGVLADTRMVLRGQDPLAAPPIDASHVPYPLTTAIVLMPLALFPLPVVTILVTLSLVATLLLLTSQSPQPPWWSPSVLVLYPPVLFQLQLVQFAPLLLLGLALSLRLRARRPWWLAICGLPLITKAQLMPILTLPLLLLLLYEKQWRALIALISGWMVLLVISWLIRPNWPLVWWQYARMFIGGYSSPALASPWLGLPLLLAAGIGLIYAWRYGHAEYVLAEAILLAALLTPQRAIYEAAALIPVLALQSPRQQLLIVAWSYIIFVQQSSGLSPGVFVLIGLYAPVMYLLKKAGERGSWRGAAPLQTTPHPRLLRRYPVIVCSLWSLANNTRRTETQAPSV